MLHYVCALCQVVHVAQAVSLANCISYKVWSDESRFSVYSDTTIEPLDPPGDCKPGDRVYAEGYDNGIHDSLYVMCAVLFCFLITSSAFLK